MAEQQDAEAIFCAALDRASPAERSAYVEGACAGTNPEEVRPLGLRQEQLDQLYERCRDFEAGE